MEKISPEPTSNKSLWSLYPAISVTNINSAHYLKRDNYYYSVTRLRYFQLDNRFNNGIYPRYSISNKSQHDSYMHLSRNRLWAVKLFMLSKMKVIQLLSTFIKSLYSWIMHCSILWRTILLLYFVTKGVFQEKARSGFIRLHVVQNHSNHNCT